MSQHLVEYAKSQGSIDNITVIVVFLTEPKEIATRLPYDNPLLANVQLGNMDPDNRFFTNANGQFDVNTPYVKQPPLEENSSPDLMDNDDAPYVGYANKSSNGKHHVENGDVSTVVVGGYDDDDLGPETNVDALDALDDGSIPGPTLADVSRKLFTADDKDDDDDDDDDDENESPEDYPTEECIKDDSPPSPHATSKRTH